MSPASGSQQPGAGGLVGQDRRLPIACGLISSYATGAVTANGATSANLGGLVGFLQNTSVFVGASYATGAVTANGAGDNHLGGLVGRISHAITISASHSSGAVTATGAGDNHSGAAWSGRVTDGLLLPPSIRASLRHRQLYPPLAPAATLWAA